MPCVVCMPFIQGHSQSGLYVLFLQTSSLSLETVANISREELQQSNHAVLNWPSPSFLFYGVKNGF